MTMMVFRWISSIVMLIFLFLGTVVPPCVSQVATPCPAEPSRPTTTYEFQLIDGTTNRVCATSNINPPVLGWIFRPTSSDARGSFRVTTLSGPTLSFCVYEDNGRPELVVTIPPGPTSGSFDVVFTSQSGVRITLSVSYVPRGFYLDDVRETELRTPSSESLWRAFGISVLDSKVCRRVGNNGLEEVSFLSPDPQLIDPTTCLHPETNPNPNPSLISLLITGNVPRELIGVALSIFLVTGSCQMPDIQSEPIAIRVLNEAVSPSPSPSLSPSTSPSQLTTTSPSLGPSPSLSPTDSLPEQDGSPITEITVGVILSVVLVLVVVVVVVVVIIVLVTFPVWKTRILSRCGQSWHNIENPPPPKPNHYHTAPGVVEPVSGKEDIELTLSTSESADSGGELQETDSGVGSGMPGTPKKSITVLTEDQNEWYQELSGTLAKLHQLQTSDIIQPGQSVDINAYSLDIIRVLTDPLFERLYVVWEGSLESKRNRPVDPFKLPLLNIVDCLESRSNDKEKIVFVQLGSSARILRRNSIKTICLEEPANTTTFSGTMCAQRIFTHVQQLGAEGTDDGRMASKSVSALPERITAEVHQQATSSWPGSRRPQPQCTATRPEGGCVDGQLEKLNRLLGQIVVNTAHMKDIAHSANRLADTSVQIENNTRQTADSARQTTDNTGQTATNSRQIADSIGQVACSTRQMAEDAHDARNLVEETRDLAEQTNDAVQGFTMMEDRSYSTTS